MKKIDIFKCLMQIIVNFILIGLFLICSGVTLLLIKADIIVGMIVGLFLIYNWILIFERYHPWTDLFRNLKNHIQNKKSDNKNVD